MTDEVLTSKTPEETFRLGERLGKTLAAGQIVLLYGGLGAGKTLLTKGVMAGLGYDVDEVTSPSFALVNLYKTERFDVYHIDLWRLEGSADPAADIGLDEILSMDNAVTIIEWADRLARLPADRKLIAITIKGDGDESRDVSIKTEQC